MDKTWLSTAEAAAYLGVAKDTIYEMVQKREIPHYKPRGQRGRRGGLLKFKRTDLEMWMEQFRIDQIARR